MSTHNDTTANVCSILSLVLFAGYLVYTNHQATPNTNITPDSLTLVIRQNGCDTWRFKDMGKFHYYTVCEAAWVTLTTSAQGGDGESENIETTYEGVEL